MLKIMEKTLVYFYAILAQASQFKQIESLSQTQIFYSLNL